VEKAGDPFANHQSVGVTFNCAFMEPKTDKVTMNSFMAWNKE